MCFRKELKHVRQQNRTVFAAKNGRLSSLVCWLMRRSVRPNSVRIDWSCCNCCNICATGLVLDRDESSPHGSMHSLTSRMSSGGMQSDQIWYLISDGSDRSRETEGSGGTAGFCKSSASMFVSSCFGRTACSWIDAAAIKTSGSRLWVARDWKTLACPLWCWMWGKLQIVRGNSSD